MTKTWFWLTGDLVAWEKGDVKTKELSITASTLLLITSLNPSCILSHWGLWATLDGRRAFQAHFQQCCRAWLGPLCTSWLFSDPCSHWISLIVGTGCSTHSVLCTEYREGLAQGSETASNTANNSYLTEMVSAYPNSRDLHSHTDTDNTNTKPTDKGKKEKVSHQ